MQKPTKDEFVHARLTPTEKAALEAIAEREDRTVSYLIRRAVLRELEEAAA